ncbi:sugar nucleotide-binding protein [Methanolobus sp. WCC5]|uniref:sugar nucleotide-binding protein n=1 Tax=Methanolobus sp. WCC5 TaxID=3125785 RepID=UPI00324A6F2E
MHKNVVVLGGTGMLGSMLVDYLSKKSDITITATVRNKKTAEMLNDKFPNVNWKVFDATSPNLAEALNVINGNEWIINAIGIIKPLIHDDNAFEVQRAIQINSILPYVLSQKAQENNAKILQIATDCVYSGNRGSYVETDVHDAHDVYGKTKSLGEVHAPNVHHIRCSIIGPEPKEFKSLLEWFLGQPPNEQLNGFINHRWNGITTLHFAKICYGIIRNDIELSNVQHVIPNDEITKFDLIKAFAKIYKREDLSILPVETKISIDRTISTQNKVRNQNIWEFAGYNNIPSIIEMVEELASYDYNFSINDDAKISSI